ncbi:MAG: hypothetical protein LBD58_10250 [Treponema sp.]|nr:hypothetical protein [Treponema sp.]
MALFEIKNAKEMRINLFGEHQNFINALNQREGYLKDRFKQYLIERINKYEYDPERLEFKDFITNGVKKIKY